MAKRLVVKPLVRALGEALAFSFKRLQFTPDLMPSDITGANIIDENGKSGMEGR